MRIEDRLDAILSARLHNTSQLPDTWVATDDELLPLLRVVDALTPFRNARPSAEFATAMEARLLALNASLMKQPDEPAAVDEANRSQAPNIYPLPDPIEHDPLRHSHQRRPQWRAWQVVAAAVLLLVAGASVLTAAAAAAGPDSPLYGLHRVEQNVRVQLASSQGDRIRLHLSYANEALAQLDAAVARHAGDHAGDPAYKSALATFSSEQLAAAQGVAALPAGSERATLDAQLATLRLRARNDLHAALHAISWSDRVATTQALGGLGETILVVQDVKVIREDGPNIHVLRLVASGSGFAPGAVITVDGQSAGTLISETATQLVVEIDATTFHLPLRAIGVSNPDGTAALSLKVEIDSGSDHSSGPPSHPTPVAHPTPTANGGHGHGSGSGG